MRKHWKDGAAPILRAQLEALESQPWRMSDGRMSDAQADLQIQNLAWANGLNTSHPRLTATNKIAELKAAGDYRELNRMYLLNGLNFESEQEQRNLIRWQGMQQKWAQEPSPEERQAEAGRLEAEQAEAARIEARALEIVAAESLAALERARAKARREITK
jgi:hypothetical protein